MRHFFEGLQDYNRGSTPASEVQTHCFHRGPPSVRRPAASSCYIRPFKQVIARRAARQCAGLLTCSPLPYKQAGFKTRRPQRPGLHICTPGGTFSTALQQRVSAGRVFLSTLHSLSALCKALLRRCHRHVAAFQPSLPSCSDRPTAS